VIEAVIFDIDGVLIDSEAANMAWFRRFLGRYGYEDLTDDELAIGHRSPLREAIAAITKADQQTVEAIFQDVKDLRDFPVEMLEVPEGDHAAVEELRGTHKMAIVTSRIRESLRQFARASDIPLGHFEAIVCYEDTMKHKPDPEPLLLACEQLGVWTGDAVYVGDAPSDRECARAAGMHFIAIGDAAMEARWHVHRFAELPAMVREMEV
jgi:HAD superfamily hydrolase (TIGR01549 family)